MSLLRLLNDRILIKYWLCCYLKFTPQPSQHLTKSEAFKKQIVWQNMHLQTLICPAPCPPSHHCLPTAERLLPTATSARKKSGRRLHIAGRKLRQKERDSAWETVWHQGTEKFTTGQAQTQGTFKTAKSHPGRGRSCTRNPTDSNSHPGRRINGIRRRSSSLFASSGPLIRCMRQRPIGVERSTRQHVYTLHCPTWCRCRM